MPDATLTAEKVKMDRSKIVIRPRIQRKRDAKGRENVRGLPQPKKQKRRNETKYASDKAFTWSLPLQIFILNSESENSLLIKTRKEINVVNQ